MKGALSYKSRLRLVYRTNVRTRELVYGASWLEGYDHVRTQDHDGDSRLT